MARMTVRLDNGKEYITNRSDYFGLRMKAAVFLKNGFSRRTKTGFVYFPAHRIRQITVDRAGA